MLRNFGTTIDELFEPGHERVDARLVGRVPVPVLGYAGRVDRNRIMIPTGIALFSVAACGSGVAGDVVTGIGNGPPDCAASDDDER